MSGQEMGAPCAHVEAHHGIAGDVGHYACDECGTTWVVAAEVPAEERDAIVTARRVMAQFVRATRLETPDPETVLIRAVNMADNLCTIFARNGDEDMAAAYSFTTGWLAASRDRMFARRGPAELVPLAAPAFQKGDRVRVHLPHAPVIHGREGVVTAIFPLFATAMVLLDGNLTSTMIAAADLVPAPAEMPSLVRLDALEAAKVLVDQADLLLGQLGRTPFAPDMAGADLAAAIASFRQVVA